MTVKHVRPYVRVADHEATALRARRQPGEWVLLGTYPEHETARNVAYRARTGGLDAYAPGGDFDTWLSLGNGRRTVWVRYVGGTRAPVDVPEDLPAPVRLVVTTTLERRPARVTARMAADLLDQHGYTDEAARARALHRAHPQAAAMQAACLLLQHDRTTRKDGTL